MLHNSENVSCFMASSDPWW